MIGHAFKRFATGKVLALTLFSASFFSHYRLVAQAGLALPRSVPEKEQVASAAITSFYDAVAKSKNELHSFMLLRHGKVIAEAWWSPYAPSLTHTMYSVSKSFTATGIGFAVTEGRLSLEDKVSRFFQGELPDSINGLQSALTIRDLITMSAGQAPDPTGAILRGPADWVQHFFRIPIVDTPGSKFLYNSAATFMLSAIIQKVTGQKLIDYLKPRLFEPLGIYNIDWEENPQGINSGGWGLRLKTEDMAKFGQFFLQKGVWGGKRLLPASWIAEASSFKIKNAADTALRLKATSDWAQGYCYQMWRCRNNAYRGDGAFGQYIIVMPDQDAVVAITSETSDMQSVLNLVWTYLLPALQAGNAVAGDAGKDYAAMRQQQAAAVISLPAYTASPMAKKLSGKTYTVASNEAGIKKMLFSFGSKKPDHLIVEYEGVTDTIGLGKNEWLSGHSYRTSGLPSLTGTTPPAGKGGLITKIAAAYTWKTDNSLEIKLRYLESPHSEVYTVHFDKNQMSLRIDNSIKAMTPGANEKNPVITGFY